MRQTPFSFQHGFEWDFAPVRVPAPSEGSDAFVALSDGDDTIVGTEGDDDIFAGAGNDLIDGRGGNDTIEGAGGTGDDTYLFGLGDGHDIVMRGTPLAAEINTLRFKPGVAPADLVLSREWRSYADDDGHPQAGYIDLRITVAATGDSVLIQSFSRLDDPFANGNPLSVVQFDNGTTWDLTAICTQAGQGTAAADLLVGFDFLQETLRGFDGNDQLIGNAGDTLLGGAGIDDLRGDAALLDGGDGDDLLQGNASAVLRGGAGNDDLYGGASLQGGAGDDFLTADAATLDGGSGNDDLVGTERSVMIGGVGDDMITTLSGGTAAEHASLRGGTGNDKLQGALYTDVFFDLGDGRDSYLGFNNTDGDASSADRASLHLGAGIATGDVHVSLDGNALVLGIGAGDAVSLTDYFADADVTKRGPEAVISIGNLVFSDGSSQDVRNWLISGTNGANTLNGTAGNDVIAGYVGNDKLSGADGNDGLHGGAGDDSLTGGNGNDTLVGYLGRDTLVGGAGDDVYYLDDVDALINEGAGAGTDTVIYSPVKYFPVTEYTLRDNFENLTLEEGGAALTGNGNALDNRIIGNALDNALNGADPLKVGADGTDTLQGGAGNDTLNGGTGNDSMEGGTGDDTYLVDSALDLTIELQGGGNDTVLAAFSWQLASEIENLQLAGINKATGKGNLLANMLTGNDGANTLQGFEGADTLDGGLGNDKLDGGKQGDTYLAYVGCGKDTVIEKDATAGVRDTAHFGELLRSEVKFVHVGDNLEARIIGTTDKLVIKDWYLGSKYQVEDFVFADGTFTGDQVAPAMDLWALEAHRYAGLIDFAQTDVWLL